MTMLSNSFSSTKQEYGSLTIGYNTAGWQAPLPKSNFQHNANVHLVDKLDSVVQVVSRKSLRYMVIMVTEVMAGRRR